MKTVFLFHKLILPSMLLTICHSVSQMDSDLYVPIATVASFNKVKAWTTDYDTIVLALKTIPAVTVDETNTKVKPNISTQRTTIILRDIDASATKEVKLNSTTSCQLGFDCGRC